MHQDVTWYGGSLQPRRLCVRWGPSFPSPKGAQEPRCLRPISRNVAWAKAYLRTKWHLDPSRRLATTNMGRKLGAVPFLGEGELGPRDLAQYGLSRGLPPYQMAS